MTELCAEKEQIAEIKARQANAMARLFPLRPGRLAKAETSNAYALSPNLHSPVIALCPTHQDN
jgi:hypothetical protein